MISLLVLPRVKNWAATCRPTLLPPPRLEVTVRSDHVVGMYRGCLSSAVVLALSLSLQQLYATPLCGQSLRVINLPVYLNV